MIVTFISECEKKALSRSRRVLDSFANRIGSRAWQTPISVEGLEAVRKLLKKSATKNTAVACHRIKTRTQTELVWVVGNRNKFNPQGLVPVHHTENDTHFSDPENPRIYLPITKALVGFAALVHDWGKASDRFQKKLKSRKSIADPLRHEWISCLLLLAFADGESDEQWLGRMAEGKIDKDSVLQKFREKVALQKPFAELSPIIGALCWLILCHHRMPTPFKDLEERKSSNSFLEQLANITKNFGYEYFNSENEPAENDKALEENLRFSRGLMTDSKEWRKELKKYAARLLKGEETIKKLHLEKEFRVILEQAKLSLILSDHFVSSKESDNKYTDEKVLYANTNKNATKYIYKQTLEEHTLGVFYQSLRTVHFLSKLEEGMEEVQDAQRLRKKSKGAFRWQDEAVLQIRLWRQSKNIATGKKQFGFFAVNMASTGTGKTFANAKIARALSANGETLRYILALGLRTLTWQTGKEYRERIGLSDSDMAIIIGSKAFLDLEKAKERISEKEDRELSPEATGSESIEDLCENYELNFGPGEDDSLHAILDSNRTNKKGKKSKSINEKANRLLFAPVLTCTIDHIIGAVNTNRGAKYILPTLRLMSSDLIIDEIDDFTGTDLVVIGRLIFLTGMLGRKVMISSATIPPDMARGYFQAYAQGWRLFAKTREASLSVGCAFIDEFSTRVKSIEHSDFLQLKDWYQKESESFIAKRVKKIAEKPVQRKAKILSCDSILSASASASDSGPDKASVLEQYMELIHEETYRKHDDFHLIDEKTGIRVSFGLVRFANIKRCAFAGRYFAQAERVEEAEIRSMVYHSRQIMLVRSNQERILDDVLNRKNGRNPLDHPSVRRHLNRCKTKNLIFIVIATPVEEVGRDHDFDWAVVEPSSFRSLIQLAGRILRHRDQSVDRPNIAILQYNFRGLIKPLKCPVFNRPGYESGEKDDDGNPLYLLESHDLLDLVDVEQLEKSVDAIPRIQIPNKLEPGKSLIYLEHLATANLLTRDTLKTYQSLEGWVSGFWWMTGLPQKIIRFRDGAKSTILYLLPGEELRNTNFEFYEKVISETEIAFGKAKKIEFARTGKLDIRVSESDPEIAETLWITHDYKELLEELGETLEEQPSIRKVAERFGEINIPDYLIKKKLEYSPEWGLIEVESS